MVSVNNLEAHRGFGFTILGSGSRGNATVIHSPDGNFLLDAGFCAKELKKRMLQRGIEPESIRAIVVTHEHQDHVKGCRVFADEYGIPAYLTASATNAMDRKNLLPEQRIVIGAGTAFPLCGVTVEPFSVAHDVADAVAYTFRRDGLKLGYATDFGYLDFLLYTKLSECDALVLESNYEPRILMASDRPMQLKRRIMSRHGHLSNENAREAVEKLLSARTRRLVFAHLSEECNDPVLVEESLRETLREMAREDVLFSLAEQNSPLETMWLS